MLPSRHYVSPYCLLRPPSPLIHCFKSPMGQKKSWKDTVLPKGPKTERDHTERPGGKTYKSLPPQTVNKSVHEDLYCVSIRNRWHGSVRHGTGRPWRMVCGGSSLKGRWMIAQLWPPSWKMMEWQEPHQLVSFCEWICMRYFAVLRSWPLLERKAHQ